MRHRATERIGRQHRRYVCHDENFRGRHRDGVVHHGDLAAVLGEVDHGRIKMGTAGFGQRRVAQGNGVIAASVAGNQDPQAMRGIVQCRKIADLLDDVISLIMGRHHDRDRRTGRAVGDDGRHRLPAGKT